MLTAKDKLENVLSSYGDLKYKDYPVFDCVIGDSEFSLLLERLWCMQGNLGEVEKGYHERVLQEESTLAHKDEKSKTRNTDYMQRFRDVIVRGLGMDYINLKKAELSKFGLEFSSSKGKLLGCKLRLADPHVHAYDPIVKILKETEEPLTIVRFDSHQDCHESKEESSDSGNYWSQILFNDSLAKKVSKVVHTYGKFFYYYHEVYNKFRDPELEKIYGKGNALRINGVPHIIMNIRDLPETQEPSLIDIDLDGCEKPVSGHPGGHLYDSISIVSLQFYNDNDIVIHPRIAAGILRTRVKNPKIVLLALERAYRNRLFWNRVEKDFIEELGL